MRVLFLSDLETHGGAAIAASRLASGLLADHVEMQWVYAIRSDGRDGEAPRWQRFHAGLPRAVEVGLHGARRVFPGARAIETRLAGRWLLAELRRHNFDILHVHAIHNSPWNHQTLSQLSPEVPTVWTFHDHWGFSPESYRFPDNEGHWVRLKPDGSDRQRAMQRRLAYFKRLRHLRLVANSSATAVYAQELLQLPVQTIRYGLPLQDYRPLDRQAARAVLELPPEAPVALFIADNVREPVKGFKVLEMALKSLSEMGIVLLLVGSEVGGDTAAARLPGVRRLGRLNSTWAQRVAYSAADITVVPSLAEALGQVAMESIACGTPVVASKVGGLPEIVIPETTGWLVESGNPAALSAQLRRLLADRASVSVIQERCRSYAEHHFGLGRQASDYLGVYRSLIVG